MQTQLFLATDQATADFACRLAPLLRRGDILLLQGPLGAGKTTLARGLIQAVCGMVEVPSPTFNLVLTYDTPVGPLWHVDLYRIEHPRELDELGLYEHFPEGLTLIEWPERMEPHVPAGALRLCLEISGDHARRLRLEGDSSWQARLQQPGFLPQ